VKKLKLKLSNEHGNPLDFNRVDGIKFFFQYENGRTLEKNNFKCTDLENACGEIELSDFEIQGLKVGVSNFTAQAFMGEEILILEFTKGLEVAVENERKVIA
jgi:hypothetical protein